jgi:outer membrane immunogenic protein
MRKTVLASLLASVALTTLVAAPAIAADLRRPPPVVRAPPPPPPPIFTWTGCYVGGHVGGLSASKEWFFNDPLFPAFHESHGDHDVSGFLAGIQGGCDYQFGGPGGGFVIGIAADFAWTNADADHVHFFRFSDDSARFRSEIDSVASVTGRLGWAWDRMLIYVKGGVAWERDKFHVRSQLFLDEWEASDTRTGFTLGVGGEFAFTPFLSAFVEANWYSFDDETLKFDHRNFCQCLHFDERIEEEKFVVKAGLNFRFGGWLAPSPVVARY